MMTNDLVKLLREVSEGPWKFFSWDGFIGASDSDGVDVAHCHGFDEPARSKAQEEANARLIALAPELAARVIELEAALQISLRDMEAFAFNAGRAAEEFHSIRKARAALNPTGEA